MEELALTVQEIKELWEAHSAAPFPNGLAGQAIGGIDVVLLDADIAGCVSTFVEQGNLNLYQAAVLGLCYKEAASVAPTLEVPGRAYFEGLEKLASLVLQAVALKNLAEHNEH